MAKPASKRRTPAPVIARAPILPIREWPWIYFLFASVALALIVFAPALNGTFIFDDYHLPFADPHAAQMPASVWLGGVRPVLIATYWLNFLISGTHPLAYHLTNVLLHAATSVMVFLIYDRLLEISQKVMPVSNRRMWALFGGALFLLHPLQTECVDYIAGRSELISGFFFFATWLVFLRNFEKDTGLILTLKVVVLAGLAVLGKESAISIPALLLLTDFYFSDRPIGKQLLRRSFLYAAFVAGGLAAVLLILRTLKGATSAGSSSGISPFEYALTQCRVILIYLRLFIVPVGQNADWKLPFFHSFTDGLAGIYALALLLVIALAFWLYKRDRLISFGLAAFFLMLAPTSSIVPISDPLAERRMYLPIAGLIFALIGAALKIPFTPAWRRAAAILALVTCSALSFDRSKVWASDFNLWNDSTRADPANSRAHFGLGSAMLARGDCAGAEREFATVWSHDKSDIKIVWNLGEARLCGKKPTEALAAFYSYAEKRPTAAAYDKIGFIEATLGHVGTALDAFEQALKLDPNNAAAYAYRGMARVALNDPQGARTDLRHALELDPGNQIAAAGMANLAAAR